MDKYSSKVWFSAPLQVTPHSTFLYDFACKTCAFSACWLPLVQNHELRCSRRRRDCDASIPRGISSILETNDDTGSWPSAFPLVLGCLLLWLARIRSSTRPCLL